MGVAVRAVMSLRGEPCLLGEPPSQTHTHTIIIAPPTNHTHTCRNLPVGAGYKELSQLFSQFGPVRYCRVLSDQNTGLNKGIVHKVHRYKFTIYRSAKDIDIQTVSQNTYQTATLKRQFLSQGQFL